MRLDRHTPDHPTKAPEASSTGIGAGASGTIALQQWKSASALRELPARQPLPPAPDEVRAKRRMIDSHGRTILDLRISITDRCNFRCVYCMEPDVRFQPADRLLTPSEIVRMAGIAEGLGVRKIRITGGEPTLHPELETIIAGIRNTTRVEIAMITNGSLLTRNALARWKRAGLDRVTISIDSVRADRFARVTRSTATPDDVMAGIDACIVWRRNALH
ncbi:MAG: radical SAM protein [Planctomycetota bacterium]|nr:radical SAM protein [Planctomycetota bacterium]